MGPDFFEPNFWVIAALVVAVMAWLGPWIGAQYRLRRRKRMIEFADNWYIERHADGFVIEVTAQFHTPFYAWAVEAWTWLNGARVELEQGKGSQRMKSWINDYVTRFSLPPDAIADDIRRLPVQIRATLDGDLTVTSPMRWLEVPASTSTSLNASK